MPFPTITPASREFTPGEWPIKQFQSQSGAEVRILYGSRRVRAKFVLGYVNIPDADAALFLEHYIDRFGTLKTFFVPIETRRGWGGKDSDLYAPYGTRWRYDSEPRVQSVFKGLSNVQVTLVAVA